MADSPKPLAGARRGHHVYAARVELAETARAIIIVDMMVFVCSPQASATTGLRCGSTAALCARSREACLSCFALPRWGYARGVVLRAARRLDAGADDRTAGRGVGSAGTGIDGSGVSPGSGADATGKIT